MYILVIVVPPPPRLLLDHDPTRYLRVVAWCDIAKPEDLLLQYVGVRLWQLCMYISESDTQVFQVSVCGKRCVILRAA